MELVKKLTFILFTASLSFGSFSQSISFNFTNGSSSNYNIEDVRKIDFSDSLMNLHLWDGTILSWNMSSVDWYDFSPNNVANVQNLLKITNSLSVVLFPNPTSDNLNVKFNIPKEDSFVLKIIDSNGKIYFEKKTSQLKIGEFLDTIDLSSIPAGHYIFMISSVSKYRISKNFVKQ